MNGSGFVGVSTVAIAVLASSTVIIRAAVIMVLQRVSIVFTILFFNSSYTP